jgi:Domain of unknown function (DUF4276)
MKRILILVEGFTEEAFIKRVLAPYLLQKGIVLQCTIITTKKVVDGPNFVGGLANYSKFKNDVVNLLGDSNAVAVTTFIDFYGLPQDFPGRANVPLGTPYDQVSHVEESLSCEINNIRFIPFLALHEFEAYLFVEPSVVQEMFPDKSCVDQLNFIKGSFANPEEINDSPMTAPSKRLSAIFGGEYQKVTHGPLVTGVVGIEKIRSECPHFDSWLTRLESLTQ